MLDTKWHPIERHHRIYQMGTSQHHQQSHLMLSKKSFLLRHNSFHLMGNKIDYLHLKGFLDYECESYLKQPLTPPQCKIIAASCTSNRRLAIETRQWSTILISRDIRLCYFCFFNAIDNEAHFMLRNYICHSKMTTSKFDNVLRNHDPLAPNS